MELVTVNSQFFAECKKNGTGTFVVPLRSNISANAPKKQYFALPPNATTKPGKRHGVHYIKMFPIKKKYVKSYKISKSSYLVVVKSIIDKNERKIIEECQNYLNEYIRGNGSPMTPDIDGILRWLE